MDEKNLLDMKLHDRIQIDPNTIVLRVPGGWIYSIITDYFKETIGEVSEEKNNSTIVFVPEPLKQFQKLNAVVVKKTDIPER